MIKVKATAVIHYISPVIDIPSKNGSQPFQKRELVLNDSWERDGKQYPNFVVMEFSGDKISQLDNFMPGHRVTVEAFINGRENNGRFYNTIRGQSIVHYQPQPATGYPVAQGYVPAPARLCGTFRLRFFPYACAALSGATDARTTDTSAIVEDARCR